jgi:hypothetical protein
MSQFLKLFKDISVENLQLVELVKNFKKLTEHRLYYNQTGYLKARKAEELHRVDTFYLITILYIYLVEK